MKTMIPLFAAFTATAFLGAQEKVDQHAKSDPKTKAHEALAMFAGDWQTICKMAAMPGVPGMEQPSESTGSEHAELICNGLWLKATMDGTFDGKPFQGMWIVGYDPQIEKYVSAWVSTQDEPASTADGTYDAATKTWTFLGKSQMGPFRSVMTVVSADESLEKCYLTGSDGKETECMQIVRKRHKGAMARDAAGTKADNLPAEILRLHDGVGTWDASVTCTIPGQAPTTETCTETVTSICGGKWTWSDFRGQLMGMPFEGHALIGYDATTQKYVSFWIDCCSPALSRTDGVFDAATKAFHFTGTCKCPEGKPMSIEQTYTQPDANTRTLRMTSKGESGTHEMKIAYQRRRR